MKFVIEVEEFWIDGSDLEKKLVEKIKFEICAQIELRTKDKVETQIAKAVDKIIAKKITQVIDITLADLVEKGMIRVSPNAKEQISMVESLNKTFMDNHGWRSPTATMRSLAEKFGKELKLRYDNIFAMHIVSNLKTQGMLKDEVVQMLLEGKK